MASEINIYSLIILDIQKRILAIRKFILDIHNTSPIISDIQKRFLDIQKSISDIRNNYF